MDLESLRRRLDEERRSIARDDERIERGASITRLHSSDGSHHTIAFSSMTPQNAEELIRSEVEHFRSIAGDVEWKVYRHDPPADLLDRLKKHGFIIGACERVLVLDLTRPAWIDAHQSYRTARVSDDATIALYRRAAEEIFQKNYQFTADELSSAIARRSTQHVGYLAFDGESVASIGRLYTHPDSIFGGLYGGGTVPGHRGRGLYRAMVAARARDASQWGAKYLIVDALPTSAPILERLGFVHLTDTWPCTLERTPNGRH